MKKKTETIVDNTDKTVKRAERILLNQQTRQTHSETILVAEKPRHNCPKSSVVRQDSYNVRCQSRLSCGCYSTCQCYSTRTGFRIRRRRISDHWMPYGFHQSGGVGNNFYDIPPRLFEKREPERRNKLIKLGEGIEIYEDQLRSIKWSDYRKLTRGLATILFSPAELATCSVTGQRWSRAGNGERPVKPALDRSKVQAIISYVAARFPMVEISRIKQVLAYKCKENSTAFKMKAVRYYGHGEQHTS